MLLPLSLRHGSNHIVQNQTFVSPAGPTGQPAVWAEQRGRNMESVLEVDNLPLSLTDDGGVIIPMLVFHLIKKKDYDDVWAVTAVRYLPAFTPMAVDRRSDQVDLHHSCSKNTATNRKALLRIVKEEIFGSASNPYSWDAYDIYINCLYSRKNGKHKEGDYPFKLDGRVPKFSTDLLDVFFDADGPGMKLAPKGK